MAKARTVVGLDVHAKKIVAAVLDVETGELQYFGMTADIDKTVGFCAGLPRPVRVASVADTPAPAWPPLPRASASFRLLTAPC